MSLNQLSMLLGLPDSDLKQIVDYANTLSKPEAADHFKNLLGDSPAAIEFIAAFNSQRRDPKPAPAPSPARATPNSSQPTSDADAVPKRPRQSKKKKANLHTPAPRQIVDTNPGPGTVYSKKSLEDEYMIGARPSGSSSTPKPASPAPQKATKPPPSAAGGTLVSDLLAPKPTKPKPKTTPTTSRSSTPGPTTKVAITGGTPMHGASGAIADLDAAIRALEITTNPTLSADTNPAARRCNCVATRHPLQTAAPNCLRCGKVICLKEGLGPCTSCGQPLLAPEDVQAMIKELKEERGREKMAADRAAHKKAEVSAAPRAFTKARTGHEDDKAAAAAREHRDRLLGFQAQNARRTTVRDEAADFDVSGWGSRWGTPEERARELKRQQKLLREMEWNAKPDYEKRQQVVSIDLVGGKVVKKFVARERPASPEAEEVMAVEAKSTSHRVEGGGAFSKNPLLGGMIKPVYEAKGKGVELEGRKDRASRWRRVQDDLDNNESVILDGGVYGGAETTNTGSAGDEPGRG